MTTTNLVPCPRSLSLWSPLSDYGLHHVAQEELDANGGVCSTCRQAIQKQNPHSKEPEQPVPLDVPQREYQSGEPDHAAWSDGNFTQTVDFNYSEVAELLGEVEALPEDAQVKAAAVLARIFAWVWSGHGSLQSSIIRYSSLFAGIRPDLLNRTYKELGKELGISRQAISKSALQCQDKIGIKFSRSRNPDQRRRMREARLRNPVYRGAKERKAE
jgi:hypothetical protein